MAGSSKKFDTNNPLLYDQCEDRSDSEGQNDYHYNHLVHENDPWSLENCLDHHDRMSHDYQIQSPKRVVLCWVMIGSLSS